MLRCSAQKYLKRPIGLAVMKVAEAETRDPPNEITKSYIPRHSEIPHCSR